MVNVIAGIGTPLTLTNMCLDWMSIPSAILCRSLQTSDITYAGKSLLELLQVVRVVHVAPLPYDFW